MEPSLVPCQHELKVFLRVCSDFFDPVTLLNLGLLRALSESRCPSAFSLTGAERP